MKLMTFLAASAAAFALSSCSNGADEAPRPIFPDAEPATQFTRAYSMTESPDGKVRVFARENGDETWLYEVRRDGKSWSAPERLEFPYKKLLVGPSFNPADGALLYASDAELEQWPGRKDLNIWQVPLENGEWGEPVPLAGNVNTGANETMAAVSEDGLMVFTSNKSGSYNLGEARQDEDGNWTRQRDLDEVNDFRTNDHIALTADGQSLFFYSHRAPKLGVVDIWVTHRQDDGTWSEPENPGEPLNSKGIDYGPGLSADGNTLFFSREGNLFQIPVSGVLPEGSDAS
jgi:WD40-like Beta Propeller Repeat